MKLFKVVLIIAGIGIIGGVWFCLLRDPAAPLIQVLVSPQAGFEQKQAAWKQAQSTGKLNLVMTGLEKRMKAHPQSAEYPATLGQACLRKAATIRDISELTMLGMKADQCFDVALKLDPSNWEARFFKAVALSYWPPQMNKGPEVIDLFTELIEQQEARSPQPQFVATYVWLGDQYQKSGQTGQARQVWQRGASLFPENRELQQKMAGLSVR